MTWVTPDVRAPLSFVAVGIFRHDIFKHDIFKHDIYAVTLHRDSVVQIRAGVSCVGY